MRENLIALFNQRLSIPLYFEFIPEDAEIPCACYVVDNEVVERSIDGDIQRLETVFSVDYAYSSNEQLDYLKCKLLELNSNPFHSYGDLFQLLKVHNETDAGPMLGLTNAPEGSVSVVAYNLSLIA